METGLTEAGDRSKDEDVQLRKSYLDAKFGMVSDNLLVQEDEPKLDEDPSLSAVKTEEANGQQQVYGFQSQEKSSIEELMDASDDNKDLKLVLGTQKIANKEKVSTERIFESDDVLRRNGDGKGKIVEANRASTDGLEAQGGGDADDATESEKTDGLLTTHFPKHLRDPLISYVRVNEGHDTALLIQGIQQSSALISSPLSSMQTSSLASDTWLRHVGSSSSQKLVEVVVDESMHGGYRPADGFLRDAMVDPRQVGGILGVGLSKEALLSTMDSSLQEPCQVQISHFEGLHSMAYKDSTDVIDSSGGRAFTSQNFRTVGMEDPVHDNKPLNNDNSLRHVLSDSFTSLLMDDAMVAQCGHSFGKSGLHRVMETNVCLSCGAPVPPGSLIPNYALRAAVQAYKREEHFWPNSLKGPKRRRDHLEQPESSEGKKANRVLAGSNENTGVDGSRPKGVQFPFVVNDRVLIKGNKRTPERFVGREAIITSQCLNGWYLVRTLDNGESVRLQYRSLQKLGDNEPTGLDAGIDFGQSGDTVGGAEGSRGQSSTSAPTSLSQDGKEDGSPSNLGDRMAVTSFPSTIFKGVRSDFSSRTNCGIRRGSSMRAADIVGASWHNGGTSSNSSQELHGEQVEEKLEKAHMLEGHGKSVHEFETSDDNGHEGLKASDTAVRLGIIDGEIEDSSFETGLPPYLKGTKGSEMWHEAEGSAEAKFSRKGTTGSAGGETIDGSTFAASNEGENSLVRSKQDVLQVQSTLLTDATTHLPESDPYKKVYVSGSRRRGVGDVRCVGDDRTSMSLKQSASASLNTNIAHLGISSLKEHRQEVEGKVIRQSSGMKHSCEATKEGMLDLEGEIPWSCMRDSWKRCRSDWLRMLQESKTSKDLGERLQDLRDALLLTKAGNMSDEEWNKQMTTALQSDAMDVVDFLRGRIYEDVSKWMESKPKRNRKPLSIKGEIIDLGDLQKLFPQLCVGGLSRAGISAATSVAAAESFADGQQDMEALLAVPMRLIREHSKQDLLAVREAIEREKRHIAAKLLQLEASVIAKEDFKDEAMDEATEVGLQIENPKQLPASPALLRADAPYTAMLTNDISVVDSEQCIDYVEASQCQDGGQRNIVPVEETDGEATDLSDSD